jgi:putative transposase
VAEILVTEHALPVRYACRAVGLSRTAWYRRPADPATRDGAVVAALTALVEQHGRWGFWKCFARLRLDGHPWNHKHVHRVYCALRLNVPRRAKRRVPTRLRQPLVAPMALNTVWALDFMHDALYGGRRFRTFNVLDEANREALAIEVGVSIPAARVIRVLEQLIEVCGRPAAFRLDNGPELTARSSPTGATSMRSRSATSNPANRIRTPSSNASTARTARRSSTPTFSPRSARCRP